MYESAEFTIPQKMSPSGYIIITINHIEYQKIIIYCKLNALSRCNFATLHIVISNDNLVELLYDMF